MTVAQQVSRGIALLDAKGPKKWRERISLRALNINDPKWCILGQLYGKFFRGLRALGLVDERYKYGFSNVWDIADESYKYGFSSEWCNVHDLETEWKRRLTWPEESKSTSTTIIGESS